MKENTKGAAWSLLASLVLLLLSIVSFSACGGEAPPEGAAVRQRDSLPIMTAEGVSKIITDSGFARYKIITEEWRYFDKTRPQRQEFRKGVFVQRFDNNAHVDLYITADTAYCYDQKLWELRGRVVVRNEAEGMLYRSQQLYWDMEQHEFYSHVPMLLITPDRELHGNRFRTNEQFTRYEVINTNGRLPMPKNATASPTTTTDTTTQTNRTPTH